MNLVGVDPERQARVGGLRDLQGHFVNLRTLAPDEALMSEAAAKRFDAVPGDVVTVYAQDQPHDLRIAAIVRNEAATGVFAFGFGQDGGGIAVPLATAQRIVGTRPASLARLRTVDLVERFTHGRTRSRS